MTERVVVEGFGTMVGAPGRRGARRAQVLAESHRANIIYQFDSKFRFSRRVPAGSPSRTGARRHTNPLSVHTDSIRRSKHRSTRLSLSRDSTLSCTD